MGKYVCGQGREQKDGGKGGFVEGWWEKVVCGVCAPPNGFYLPVLGVVVVEAVLMEASDVNGGKRGKKEGKGGTLMRWKGKKADGPGGDRPIRGFCGKDGSGW